MTRVRMDPKERAAAILEHAFKVAKKTGLRKMTHNAVAEAAGVTPGLVGVYYPGRATLRKAVVKRAIAAAHTKLIEEGKELGLAKGLKLS